MIDYAKFETGALSCFLRESFAAIQEYLKRDDASPIEISHIAFGRIKGATAEQQTTALRLWARSTAGCPDTAFQLDVFNTLLRGGVAESQMPIVIEEVLGSGEAPFQLLGFIADRHPQFKEAICRAWEERWRKQTKT